MKKSIFLKLVAVSILLGTGFWFESNSTKVEAAWCWEGLYNAWSACDGGYSTIRNNHTFAPTNCGSSATSAANSSCGSSSNQPCWNNAYTASYNSCITTDQSAYDGRYTTYGNCMSGANNNCVENIDFCDAARGRRDACNMYTFDSEDYGAYSACIAASGIWSCE